MTASDYNIDIAFGLFNLNSEYIELDETYYSLDVILTTLL